MTWQVACGVLSLVVAFQGLLLWIQRRVLIERGRALLLYKDEVRRASELMAVMAREDVAHRRVADRDPERRPLDRDGGRKG